MTEDGPKRGPSATSPRRAFVAAAVVATLVLVAGCGSQGSSASSGPCSINYQDIEIHLSSGGTSCQSLEQQRASYGEQWVNGPVTGSDEVGTSSETTACTLTNSGQNMQITYGDLGDATQASQLCSSFISTGWTQK